jgi:hypothetical protein
VVMVLLEFVVGRNAHVTGRESQWISILRQFVAGSWACVVLVYLT